MTRGLRWTVGGVAGLVLLGGATAGWLGWTARQAERELRAARQDLPAVRAAVLTGDGDAATRLAVVRRHAVAADEATHDPVWAVAAGVPYLGTPAATTRGLTRAVRELAETGMPALVEAADDVHPARLLRGGGRLDVTGLAAALPALDRAAGSLTRQQADVAALSPSWVGSVAQARGTLLAELTPLAGTSRSAARAAALLPPMLGADGPRRYFLAFQNPAEARGTGGLLDAYAIIKADHGAVTVERTGANTQLPRFGGDVTGLPAEFVARYAGTGGTSDWLNANQSPDFPDVATAWRAMWRKATGEQLDGVLALDPRSLAAALTATGPVTAPVVGRVDAHRIESLVLHEQYRWQQRNDQRKSLMLGVGTAAIQALLHGKASPTALLTGLQQAARQGHVQVFSRVPAEQAALVDAGVSGRVDPTTGPFAEAVLVNSGGNKLDSWLASTLRYRVEQCTPVARSTEITVTLRNGAPRSGLPGYVSIRSDRPDYPTVPGQNRTELHLLLTRGAQVREAGLDGAPLPLAPRPGQVPTTLPADLTGPLLQQGDLAGRPEYWLDLELPPGATRTLVLRITEPPGTASPLLPVQPLVLGTAVSADTTACTGARSAA